MHAHTPIYTMFMYQNLASKNRTRHINNQLEPLQPAEKNLSYSRSSPARKAPCFSWCFSAVAGSIASLTSVGRLHVWLMGSPGIPVIWLSHDQLFPLDLLACAPFLVFTIPLWLLLVSSKQASAHSSNLSRAFGIPILTPWVLLLLTLWQPHTSQACPPFHHPRRWWRCLIGLGTGMTPVVHHLCLPSSGHAIINYSLGEMQGMTGDSTPLTVPNIETSPHGLLWKYICIKQSH